MLASLEGMRVLVLGGTGSMGRVAVRRLLAGEMRRPQQVVVFSRDEAKQHDLRLEHQQRQTGRRAADELRRLAFRLGDIRNYADVACALRGIDVVINAAALKQVPNCEYFPEQALLTNCIGPANLVRAIAEHALPVQAVVGISTDKACKPVNAMGMTKALHERILLAANLQCPQTRFVCARYGNVMGSRGSVIPLFQEQIRRGGPVTITVPGMTRFLMSLDEAVDCVFAALREARPGETYIPCMPSATILDLARALVGARPIGIQTTGIRPGEKLHEMILSEEEAPWALQRGNYLVLRSLLPELRGNDTAPGLTRAYSSADVVLDPHALREFLARHGLVGKDALRTSATLAAAAPRDEAFSAD